MTITSEDRARAERIRLYRKAHGLTQDQFADACGLDRTEMNKLERARNKASSGPIRASLARGMGVSTDDAVAYIEGQIDLAELIRRRGNGGPKRPGETPVAPSVTGVRKAI